MVPDGNYICFCPSRGDSHTWGNHDKLNTTLAERQVPLLAAKYRSWV